MLDNIKPGPESAATIKLAVLVKAADVAVALKADPLKVKLASAFKSVPPNEVTTLLSVAFAIVSSPASVSAFTILLFESRPRLPPVSYTHLTLPTIYSV